MRQIHSIELGALRTAVLVAAAVVVVAVGAGLFWFLSGDEPAEVDLETAAAVVSTTQAGTSEDLPPPGTESSDEDPAGAGIDGTWTVDTSIGSFSFENATSSFVGFRVAEELASIGATEAVGRTPAVSGSLEIEGTSLVAASIEADFTAIVSNDSRRDNRIQDALETDQFPTATFELTEPVDFGAIPAEGEAIAVTARGDLTVHGVTNSIEIPLEAQLIEDVIVVVGSTEVVFADYGVEVPSAVIVVSAEDRGPIELQLFFTR